MRREVPVVVFASMVAIAGSCGGGSRAAAPAQPREPQRAAIAPPPPIPEIHVAEPGTDATEGGAGASSSSSPAGPAAASVFDVAPLAGAPAGERLAGSVLVWVDAKFYLAPKDGAQSVQLARLERRTDRLGEAVPMRVIATKGAFVEVESLVPDEANNMAMDCAWFGIKTQLDMERWRLFVKREELAPVVRTRYVKTFADGSAIELLPGAPIVPLADGRTLASVGALWVPLAIPAASIGHSYASLAPSKDKPFDPQYKLAARDVAIADTRVAWRGAFAPLAERIETRGNAVAFPVVDRCGTATVVTSSEQVRPYTPASSAGGGGIGIGHGIIVGQDRWYLPRGIRLVADDGGKVSATTRDDISVSRPAPGDKLVCIERSPLISTSYVFGPKLDAVTRPNIRLCAPVKAVKHDKGAPPFGRSGFGGGLGKRPR